ncbi:MAG: hypothetical protein LBU50_00725 [Cellulomonas sp.]|jgi:hypothetical protein|nr:hypothetical protein [Cellulomonas sp.]
MEREHIAGLAMVREVAAMTQDDVTRKMGVAHWGRRGDRLPPSLASTL